MSSKKILIIQTSPPHTASTLLVNALYGIIEELNDTSIFYDEKAEFIDDIIEKKFYNKNIAVIKTHNTNIEKLTNIYKDKYELYFICSQRLKHNLYIEKKYLSYTNVVIFNFIELNETTLNDIPKIINNIYNHLNNLLSKYEFVKLNKETGIERIHNMNKIYDEIKSKPFSYVDPFFEIHGSHRNRKGK
jgi:hypothetical protein